MLKIKEETLMDRINKIIRNDQYIYYLNQNFVAEIERLFCHHDFRHALDVSRVAYILSLEEYLCIEKDVIYAAGLLHDIGRWKEYAQGVDHAMASADLAVEILSSSGYNHEEGERIYSAISNHRKHDEKGHPLDKILYKSDKIARPCNACAVIERCKRFNDEEKPMLYY